MSKTYLVSGIIFAFTASALVAYPLAAAFRPDGVAPAFKHWLVLTALLACITSAYTALARRAMRPLNSLVLLLFFSALLGGGAATIPNVSGNLFEMTRLAVFTFGAPFLIPFVAFIIHTAACADA